MSRVQKERQKVNTASNAKPLLIFVRFWFSLPSVWMTQLPSPPGHLGTWSPGHLSCPRYKTLRDRVLCTCFFVSLQISHGILLPTNLDASRGSWLIYAPAQWFAIAAIFGAVGPHCSQKGGARESATTTRSEWNIGDSDASFG